MDRYETRTDYVASIPIFRISRGAFPFPAYINNNAFSFPLFFSLPLYEPSLAYISAYEALSSNAERRHAKLIHRIAVAKVGSPSAGSAS